MSHVSTLRLGSRGNDVVTLQTLLNQNGASLSVDGIFGEKTLSALKSYQAQKGLDADGVAGKNTWSALTAPAASSSPSSGVSSGSSSSAASSSSVSPSPYAGLSGVSPETAAQLSRLESGFQPSEETLALRDALNRLAAEGPGEFSSPYQQELDSLYESLSSRQPFSYSAASDPLFQQYRDLYQNSGRLSMMDTLGQAAALTGGYANSYAQTAAQQSYDQTLGQLYQLLPDFYSMALSSYQSEGDRLADLYETAYGRYQADYDRYQNDASDYFSRLSYQQSLYENQLDLDFKTYSQLLSYWQDRADSESEDFWNLWEASASSAASSSSGASSSSSKSSSSKSASPASSKAASEETWFFPFYESGRTTKNKGKSNPKEKDAVYYY